MQNRNERPLKPMETGFHDCILKKKLLPPLFEKLSRTWLKLFAESDLATLKTPDH